MLSRLSNLPSGKCAVELELKSNLISLHCGFSIPLYALELLPLSPVKICYSLIDFKHLHTWLHSL